MNDKNLNLVSTFSALKQKTNGIKLSSVRSSRLVYFLAYAIELILFATRGQFMPIGASLFGFSGWTIANVAHMIASLVFMLLWSDKFKKLIYVSIAIMIVGFVPFVFVPKGYLSLGFAVLFYIGLGGAVTSCRCGYAFASNNAERLVSIVFMFFSVATIRFIRSFGVDNVFFTKVLPLILLALLCLCLFKFKEEDFEVKQVASKSDAKGLYWAFAFFALYFAFDGYNSALTVGKNNPDFLFFFIGMILAGIILYFSIAKLRLNTWHIWNIFFVASFCMGLLAVFSAGLGTEKPQYFFGGLSMIGWPLCIYVLGCAQRRFADYKILKKCTLIYVLFSPIIVLSSDVVESFAESALPYVAMVFILAFGIGFLMLSYKSLPQLFTSEWMLEIYDNDMQLLQEKVEEKDRFNNYNLTPRQKEIAVFLLSAKTRRQIAGELKLSESTVKMHTGELYKRLSINSRAELFRMFGIIEIEQMNENLDEE